MKYDWDD